MSPPQLGHAQGNSSPTRAISLARGSYGAFGLFVGTSTMDANEFAIWNMGANAPRPPRRQAPTGDLQKRRFTNPSGGDPDKLVPARAPAIVPVPDR